MAAFCWAKLSRGSLWLIRIVHGSSSTQQQRENTLVASMTDKKTGEGASTSRAVESASKEREPKPSKSNSKKKRSRSVRKAGGENPGKASENVDAKPTSPTFDKNRPESSPAAPERSKYSAEDDGVKVKSSPSVKVLKEGGTSSIEEYPKPKLGPKEENKRRGSASSIDRGRKDDKPKNVGEGEPRSKSSSKTKKRGATTARGEEEKGAEVDNDQLSVKSKPGSKRKEEASSGISDRRRAGAPENGANENIGDNKSKTEPSLSKNKENRSRVSEADDPAKERQISRNKGGGESKVSDSKKTRDRRRGSKQSAVGDRGVVGPEDTTTAPALAPAPPTTAEGTPHETHDTRKRRESEDEKGTGRYRDHGSTLKQRRERRRSSKSRKVSSSRQEKKQSSIVLQHVKVFHCHYPLMYC